MMGIQIGGGEWLFGPEITARYGGGLMWIATVAIVLQVFYNLECGRYALYCGEPVFTGFMRIEPGPAFVDRGVLPVNLGAPIPGLSTQGRPCSPRSCSTGPPARPTAGWYARWPLFSSRSRFPSWSEGKVYNTLQAVMTVKVVVVLGFCLAIGVLCVRPSNWLNVLSGFLKFGTVPTVGAGGHETTVNLFAYRWTEGGWPAVRWAISPCWGRSPAMPAAAGWPTRRTATSWRQGLGMGQVVGAIPTAVEGGTSPSATSARSSLPTMTICAAGGGGGGTCSPISYSSGARAASWEWRPACFLDRVRAVLDPHRHRAPRGHRP